MKSTSVTPCWIWGIIVALPASEPLMHFWLKHFLPGRFAHTGFHIGDTPFFLTAMGIFQNGFTSPYALCDSALGPRSAAYFALPHHWVYGALGYSAHVIRGDAFIVLGWANGVCGALYLWAVYRFLTTAAPARARLAFLLFALGGGLAGVLYCAAGPLQEVLRALGMAGLYPLGGFEAFFHRYARYELLEGPFIAPLLVMPRLYYTLPMALGFLALTSMLRRLREHAGGPSWSALAGLFCATYLNARVGMMFGLVIAVFVYTDGPTGAGSKTRWLLWPALAAGVAGLLVALQFRMNPEGVRNVHELLRRCAWFGSLAGLLFWHFFTVPRALGPVLGELPPAGRIAAHAAVGFLVVFAVLYGTHQAYYGNLLTGGDTAAAVAISDWALIGALGGAAWGFGRGARNSGARAELDWAALWLLGFLCVSVSAFGHGRFLSFMPERFLALTGVPLAVLSADGLARWRVRGKARWAGAWLAAILVCGFCSAMTASLFFQLPVGRSLDTAAFRWAHSEIMPPQDKELIGAIPSGVVLAPASAPPLLGDVAVCGKAQVRTVFGQPSLEFSGAPMRTLSEAIQHFYSNGASDEERRAFIRAYCVEYVLCPAAHPVGEETLRQLRSAIWLECVAGEDGSALFRVIPGALL